MSKAKQYFVYFLQSGRKSYVGFSVNVTRRLRQHRGELVGGAKYTSRWPRRENLQLVAYITGFPTKHSALSYEWHAKRVHPSTQTFLPVEKTHRRLPGFFYPSTTAKFQPVQSELQVTLFHHHAIVPLLGSRFNLTRVQCLSPL